LPCFRDTPQRSRYSAKSHQFTGIDIFDRDNVQSDQSEQSDSDEEIGEGSNEENEGERIGNNEEDNEEENEEEIEEEENTVDDTGINKLRWNLNERFHGSGLHQEEFNLINSRFLADGVDGERWPSLVRDCFNLLVPGGWLQMVEPVWAFQSDLGQDLPCLEAWWNHYAEALRLMLKNARVGRDLFEHMRVAGFRSITPETHDVPAAGWKDGMTDSAHTSLFVSIRG
jgi:hypothetical protein